jgi:hypothetical protein
MEMISSPVYQPPQRIALDPTKKLPDKYFGYSPDELEQEYMRYAMQLIDTLDYSPSLPDHIRKNDAAIYSNEMDRIERRILRYARDRRLKYKWPDRSKYEEMLQIGQEMKIRYPLERFILDHVLQCDLRKAGDSWLGNCPIPTHDDTTPSFRVYDSVRFHCYGCRRSGDIFELIGLVYGIEGFSERLQYLAEVMS